MTILSALHYRLILIERYERLLTSISEFQGKDLQRLASSIEVLVGGQIDTKDDGNPTRSPVDRPGNFSQRLVLILQNLSVDNVNVTKLVLSDIEDYLIFRISNHRQQTNQDDYPQRYGAQDYN